MSSFRQGYIEGESSQGNDLNALVAGCYDLMILTSSWDARCLCAAECAQLKAKQSAVVLFSTRDPLHLRDEHDPTLVSFAKSASETYQPVEGDSACIERVWSTLHQAIVRLRSDVGRPLNVYMDMSTCPRYLIGGMVGVSLRQGLVSRLMLSYSEAIYPEPSAGTELPFTGSRWRTIAMPGLQGSYDPRCERFYLVSVGFEGTKTFRAVTRADPDRVSILLPHPGFRDDYSERARERNRELLDEYCGNDERSIVAAPAGDAVAAWRRLAERPQEKAGRENTCYLCCGTKPHALALALRAMALEYPAVLYNVSQHTVIPTKSSGCFWGYGLRNVAAIQ